MFFIFHRLFCESFIVDAHQVITRSFTHNRRASVEAHYINGLLIQLKKVCVLTNNLLCYLPFFRTMETLMKASLYAVEWGFVLLWK